MVYVILEKALGEEDQAENSFTLTSGRIGVLNDAEDLHDVAAIRGRLNKYVRQEKLEPGNLMGWEVDYFTLGGGLEIILEGISDVHNTNSEAVSGSNYDNRMGWRGYQNQGGRLIKAKDLHQRSPIRTMARKISVYVAGYIIDDQRQNITENLGSAWQVSTSKSSREDTKTNM